MVKHTTRNADALYVIGRMAAAARTWAVGDACQSYNGREVTTVASIELSIVTLANGDSMHSSKMREVR